MNALLNTLGKRLGASFGLVLCLLLGVAAASSIALSLARALSEKMVEVVMPAIGALQEAETTHLSISVLVRDVVSSRNLSAQAKTRNDLEAQNKQLEQALSGIKTLVAAEEYEGLRGAVGELLDTRAKAGASIKRAIELVDRTQYDEAKLVVYDELRPLQAAMSERLAAVRSEFVTLNSDAMKAEADRNARSITFILGVTLVAVCVGLVAAIWITRLVTRPIALAVGAAERIAEGDLNERIRGGSGDETGRLLDALEKMRAGLVAAVGTIRETAQSVSAASRQIAAGNTELSSRTEEQASSLEETSSSMEELTSTVKLNADAAKQVNALAQAASAVAERGGKAMGDVTGTMADIAQASRKIADIVGVIDGIAFQTNILALNAAVEAARAGEQGRGFAVVATEVRGLAQRSATAAKEIKGLIQSSTERVDGGAKLVEGAGSTMQEIVLSIRQLSDIMGGIASASQEQLSGIQQIGKSVMQMEQITQQNASLVEESAAAAENMSAQADHLVHAVARFKMDGAQAGELAQPAADVNAAVQSGAGTRPDAGTQSQPRLTHAPRSPAPAKAPEEAVLEAWDKF